MSVLSAMAGGPSGESVSPAERIDLGPLALVAWPVLRFHGYRQPDAVIAEITQLTEQSVRLRRRS